jgi:hypothetical protein
LRQEKVDVAFNQSDTLSPFGALVIFSHISRLLFNRRPFLERIYQEHLTTLKPVASVSKKSPRLEPFLVSLHIRRGDSCSEEDPQLYQSKASPIDSEPQMATNRRCYQTQVYLDAIERIRKLLPKSQPLIVYLATDDTENVMEEIQKNHSRVYNDVVDQWKFLNYSRNIFQYEQAVIEDEENTKRPILGETAVSDLWHLSHGQAFVGHLGSRFGKVAWMLAISRHGAFIPYFSVDGHSKLICSVFCRSQDLSVCFRQLASFLNSVSLLRSITGWQVIVVKSMSPVARSESTFLISTIA